jgi:hypothetical protein
MSAYQGRVLAFIRDQRATKDPNPVCMPTTKTWEWFYGNVVTNFAAFKDDFAIKASCGTLWTPVVGENTSGAFQVQHLLAIPNVLVDLLRTQRTAFMPHEVLMTVEDFILSSLHPACPQWEAFGSGASLLANLGPTGRVRSSWKPAPSQLMTMTLTAGSIIV